jgi:hypothetical protein
MVLNILVMNTWVLLVVTSYDISGTVDGKGSKGALHGLTKFSMEDAPANSFF